MALQSFTVAGSPSRRYNQTAELNARQGYLPQLIANQQRATELVRQKELDAEQRRQFRSNFNLQRRGQRASQQMQKQQFEQDQAESRVGMGLEGLKLGSTVAQRYGGNKNTVGNLFSGGGSASGAPGTKPPAPSGMLSRLNIGQAVGSGLAGFGAAKMLGGGKKSPFKKAALGAVGGGLLGFLGGGKSGGLGGAVAGGLGGLGASLF